MGFTDVAFQEEMAGRYDLPADRWGVRDADVLRLSAQQLRTAKTPTCHFVITLTTHTPYTNLTAPDRDFFPDPRTTGERYINNMRYLDNCLRDYVTSLGSGTTVLLYADHPAEAFDNFAPDRDVSRELEYVPCFIYDSDRDLSTIQKTRNLPDLHRRLAQPGRRHQLFARTSETRLPGDS